tara:strand:- start:109533 stop:109760 length:228 start_codon:yes stop_codon:yes gene_type:complete
MGSPAVATMRRLRRLEWAKGASPFAMKERMAVGAVYKTATPCASITWPKRVSSGKLGKPSHITTVAPFARGPYTR